MKLVGVSQAQRLTFNHSTVKVSILLSLTDEDAFHNRVYLRSMREAMPDRHSDTGGQVSVSLFYVAAEERMLVNFRFV